MSGEFCFRSTEQDLSGPATLLHHIFYIHEALRNAVQIQKAGGSFFRPTRAVRPASLNSRWRDDSKTQ